MGLYYQPPSPHVGRQQPLENRKLPPDLALVDTPPFAVPSRRAGTRETLYCVVPAWAPDLSRPFVGGRQPLAGDALNPALETVPDPPFAVPSRRAGTRETFAGVLPAWAPDLSRPYVGWGQPLDPRNLNPALETVPNPPFAHPLRQSNSVEFGIIRQAWDVAWTLPPQREFSLPQVVAAVDNPPFGMPPDWLTTILASWRSPDPPPQRDYPIQILSVDTPPFKMPPLWLATVLASWRASDPFPQRDYPVQIVSVDTPPPVAPGAEWLSLVLRAWTPPDPMPPSQRPVQVVSVDPPPGHTPGAAWLSLVQQAWTQPDPTPQRIQPVYLQSVDDPPRTTRTTLYQLVSAWQPGDPVPIRTPIFLPIPLPVSTDDPPFHLQFPIYGIVRAWEPGPPFPINRRPVVTESGVQIWTITGQTLTCAGAILASCSVLLFRTSDNAIIGTTTSDASGNYTFTVPDGTTHYFLVAYHPNAPDTAGTTLNTIVGS